MDLLLEETATRIFTNLAGDPEGTWAALEENGLTRVWAREEDNGFDLPPSDGFGLIRLAGYHAISSPLAETLIAGWLLAEAGMPQPAGPLTVAIHDFQGHVPFGANAEHLLWIEGRSLKLVRGHLQGSIDQIGLDPASPMPAGSPEVVDSGFLGLDFALRFAALARAAQICGVIDAALELTIGFAEQREQFGRSISKFQAIQHLLSEMGSEAASASAALDMAVMKVRHGEAIELLAIATAKCRAGIAANIVAEHAHQVHGAIGYTEEYGLARLTRRLWQWREDFGSDSYWAIELGGAVLAANGPLWPRLTSGSL